MKKHLYFTLVEILIALAVLTMSVTSLLMLTSSSTRRMRKAMDKWEANHALMQAVEFYMLYPLGAEIERRFFDHEKYSISSEYNTPDDLPDGVDEVIGQLRLVSVTVKLHDKNGRIVNAIKMDRIAGALKK